jgi:hypothetical protein
MKKIVLKKRNFVAKDLFTPKYAMKRHRTAKDYVRSIEKNKIKKEITDNYANN